MRIGYARTPTVDQTAGFEAQIKELEAAGCEKLFREQVLSMAKRQQLEAALDYIRDGDTLVVCKLDRLGRTKHSPSSKSASDSPLRWVDECPRSPQSMSSQSRMEPTCTITAQRQSVVVKKGGSEW